MHGGLADPEVRRAGADGGARFQNVFGALARPPLHVFPHRSSPCPVFWFILCRTWAVYEYSAPAKTAQDAKKASRSGLPLGLYFVVRSSPSSQYKRTQEHFSGTFRTGTPRRGNICGGNFTAISKAETLAAEILPPFPNRNFYLRNASKALFIFSYALAAASSSLARTE